MAIFDTNLIIDFMNGYFEAAKIIEKNAREHGGIAITSVIAFELIKGIGDIEKEQLSEFFHSVKLYDTTLDSCWIAGDMYKKLKRRGFTLSEADLLIVGVALSNNEIFVTRDKDFGVLSDNRIKIIKS